MTRRLVLGESKFSENLQRICHTLTFSNEKIQGNNVLRKIDNGSELIFHSVRHFWWRYYETSHAA
jgi:hypothetical protein